MALSLSTRISLLPRLNSSREIYSKVARISERATTAQRLDPPRGGTLSTSKRILARVSCCTSPSSSMAPVTCSRYLTLETRHRVLETGHGSCWTRVCWKQPVKTEECRSVGLIPSSQISHSCIYIYLESSFHADTPSCPFLSSRALLEILLPGIVRKNVIHQGLGFGRRILDQFSSNTPFPNTSFRVNFNSKRRRNESNGWSILEITSFADFYLFFKFLFQIFLSRCFYLFISLVSLSLSLQSFTWTRLIIVPPPPPPSFLSHFFADSKVSSNVCFFLSSHYSFPLLPASTFFAHQSF